MTHDHQRGQSISTHKTRSQMIRRCDGNGSVAIPAQAPGCTVEIRPGQTFWSVHWPRDTAPRQTDHCEACYAEYILGREGSDTPF